MGSQSFDPFRPHSVHGFGRFSLLAGIGMEKDLKMGIHKAVDSVLDCVMLCSRVNIF